MKPKEGLASMAENPVTQAIIRSTVTSMVFCYDATNGVNDSAVGHSSDKHWKAFLQNGVCAAHYLEVQPGQMCTAFVTKLAAQNIGEE